MHAQLLLLALTFQSPSADVPPPAEAQEEERGRILRDDAGAWDHWLIQAGPQGPRGIVAGRFHADGREAVAVFGYSREVQLLFRPESGRGRWRAETLFTDRDKGHWLAAAELDGRNGTDEILASGYGARIVLLARPPGYGLEEAEAGER